MVDYWCKARNRFFQAWPCPCELGLHKKSSLLAGKVPDRQKQILMPEIFQLSEVQLSPASSRNPNSGKNFWLKLHSSLCSIKLGFIHRRAATFDVCVTLWEVPLLWFFYKIGLGRCREFFLLSLTPLWPNSECRETQKCQVPYIRVQNPKLWWQKFGLGVNSERSGVTEPQRGSGWKGPQGLQQGHNKKGWSVWNYWVLLKKKLGINIKYLNFSSGAALRQPLELCGVAGGTRMFPFCISGALVPFFLLLLAEFSTCPGEVTGGLVALQLLLSLSNSALFSSSESQSRAWRNGAQVGALVTLAVGWFWGTVGFSSPNNLFVVCYIWEINLKQDSEICNLWRHNFLHLIKSELSELLFSF